MLYALALTNLKRLLQNVQRLNKTPNDYKLIYAERDFLYLIFITLHLYRYVRNNCFQFFSDVDSEATEGNTENEQEDVRPITGETICFTVIEDKSWSFWNLEFDTLFCCPANQVYLSSFLLPGYKRGPWSLVCETEEQWVSLAESIKDKTSPQDRHLYRIISQNFLPEISSMIEHKVRPLGGTCL